MNELTVRVPFAEDHDRLDELLETYRRWKRSDFARAKAAFKEFKFGLQRHIIWEERILFPRFEEKTGMRDVGPTAVMRAEHRQIGACLEALHEKVRKQDPESEAEEARLLELLTAHNQKEENILYPAIDQLLTPVEQATVHQEMADLPAEAYQTCCGHSVGVAGTHA